MSLNLPSEFSIPRELQWMETIGISEMGNGEVLADKVAGIHSSHYSSSSINSARRLWNRTGIQSTYVGKKYRALLDAIYARHTVITIALVCFYCKKSDPRELTCQDLERFFQSTSDVISATISDESLPLTDAHIRLLLQHLLSNDDLRLSFSDFIYNNNTSEEGVTQMSLENACRVLVVFYPKHKLIMDLLQFMESSGTRTVGKYLWPMLFSFLSTYHSAEDVVKEYRFDSSIYPVILDNFCKNLVESRNTAMPHDVPIISETTKLCLQQIDSVLRHSEFKRDELPSQSQSNAHTPNTIKRVQFAGLRDEASFSFTDYASPQTTSVPVSSMRTEAPRRMTTPLTEGTKSRPPSALSQKQMELAARLAAFKAASSQRRPSFGTMGSSSIKSVDNTISDPFMILSPSNAPINPASSSSGYSQETSTKPSLDSNRNSDVRTSRPLLHSATSSDVLAASALMAPHDKMPQVHPLVKDPYLYISPVAAIIADARKAIEASTRHAPSTAAPSQPSRDSAALPPGQTTIYRPRIQSATISAVASKYIARTSVSSEPDCITVQPVQPNTPGSQGNAPVSSISVTPMLIGGRKLSATAAKYISMNT